MYHEDVNKHTTNAPHIRGTGVSLTLIHSRKSHSTVGCPPSPGTSRHDNSPKTRNSPSSSLSSDSGIPNTHTQSQNKAKHPHRTLILCCVWLFPTAHLPPSQGGSLNDTISNYALIDSPWILLWTTSLGGAAAAVSYKLFIESNNTEGESRLLFRIVEYRLLHRHSTVSIDGKLNISTNMGC